MNNHLLEQYSTINSGENIYQFYLGIRHCTGPVNNVLVIRRPQYLNPRSSASSMTSPVRRPGALPPPLEKFANSADENAYIKAFIGPQTTSNQLLDSSYISVQTMEAQIKELQVHYKLLIDFLHNSCRWKHILHFLA